MLQLHDLKGDKLTRQIQHHYIQITTQLCWQDTIIILDTDNLFP